MKSILPIISLMNCAFGVVPKKSLPNLRTSRFFSYLSSYSFTVFSFTLRSIIHFELISVKWIVSLSVLLFKCPVIPATFSKKIILVPLYFLCSFVTNQLIILYIYVGFFLGSPFCSIDLSVQYHTVLITVAS